MARAISPRSAPARSRSSIRAPLPSPKSPRYTRNSRTSAASCPRSAIRPGQLDALRRTIEASGAEVVVAATPADVGSLLRIAKPVIRVRYEFQDLDSPGLWGSVEQFLASKGLVH